MEELPPFELHDMEINLLGDAADLKDLVDVYFTSVSFPYPVTRPHSEMQGSVGR